MLLPLQHSVILWKLQRFVQHSLSAQNTAEDVRQRGHQSAWDALQSSGTWLAETGMGGNSLKSHSKWRNVLASRGGKPFSKFPLNSAGNFKYGRPGEAGRTCPTLGMDQGRDFPGVPAAQEGKKNMSLAERKGIGSCLGILCSVSTAPSE